MVDESKSPTGDPLIAETEEAGRAQRAANLFDLRRILAGLFFLYGAILTVLGIGASDADIRKAAGININLWVGLGMLVLAALFLAWALWRPLGEQIGGSSGDEPGGGAGGDAPGAVRGGGPGREERGGRPAEAAPAPARAGGAGVLEHQHRVLDLGDAGVVEVAERGMGGVEQPTEGFQVLRPERGDRGVDARVLGEHVLGAGAQRRVERRDGGGVGGAQV